MVQQGRYSSDISEIVIATVMRDQRSHVSGSGIALAKASSICF